MKKHGYSNPPSRQHLFLNRCQCDMIKKLLLILIVCKAFGLNAECRKDTVYLYNIGTDPTQKILLSRSINNYNGANLIISETIHLWDNMDWNNSTLKEYSYDGNNNNNSIIKKTWRNIDSTWVNNNKTVYTYDNAKNITELLDQTWSAGINDWVNNIKILYTYDANNRNISTSSLKWNNNAWDNKDRTERVYSPELTLESGFVWNKDSVKWINNSKKEYTYNGNKQLIEKTSSGKNQFNAWVYQTKNTYTYYSGNNLLKDDIRQNWSINTWVNLQKLSYAYNGSNLQTEINSQYWNSGNANWDNDSKTTFEYKPNGDMTAMDDYFSWSSSTGKYAIRRRQEFRCAFSVGLSSPAKPEAVSIYPNPSNTAQINVNIETPAPFVLFDMMGQLISEGIFDRGHNILALNEQLSNGIYLLQIDNTIYKLVYSR